MRAEQALLAALVMTTLLAGCRVERRERAAVVNTDSVARVEIRATSDRYHQALRAHDAAAAASFFSDTALVAVPGLPALHGVDDVRRMFRDAFRAPGETDPAMTTGVVDITGRGVAWEQGSYSGSPFSPADSTQPVSGQYALRWIRGPESIWQIDRLLIWQAPAPADSVETETAAGS